MAQRFFIETLGCPKNSVDSEKIAGSLLAEGYLETERCADADLVVVNTCAFIDAAREESVETILDLLDRRRPGARVVVTGCLAARQGDELAEALPEVDVVAELGAPVTLRRGGRLRRTGERERLSLMEGPRRPAGAPWAYVRIAEGCDRACGFCAIPSFRGPQRSRTPEAILAEVDALGVAEVVLVAQDLASYARDLGRHGALSELVGEIARRVAWVRLLYLYPSALSDALIEAIAATGVPYYDLSLQHVSAPHLRRMRRFGSTERFLGTIARIRAVAPDAALRSSFIVGYPGETEEDHDALLGFLEAAELDWVGLFRFSREEGTYAAGLPDEVPEALAMERLREAGALAEEMSAARRRALVGSAARVLVDRPGVARSHREAPEIDGVISVPEHLAPGRFHDVVITDALGPDLRAEPLAFRASR